MYRIILVVVVGFSLYWCSSVGGFLLTGRLEMLRSSAFSVAVPFISGIDLSARFSFRSFHVFYQDFSVLLLLMCVSYCFGIGLKLFK